MSDSTQNRNLLAEEKSPYLLQHKDNPVWWQPWNEQAFARAKNEDKPIFLSIGYATCHWCHVMEHESFEDAEVAQILNNNFVSIKIDREELPDVDQVYMRVVQAISGHGGWPMTVIMTADQAPFFGGTYFPKKQLMQLLTQISAAWKGDRTKIHESASGIVEHFRSSRTFDTDNSLLNETLLKRALEYAQQEFDPRWGGFGAAPKFPPAQRLSLLLRVYDRFKDERALTIVEKTLSEMASGGIYDHLGGGFSRYSTDAKWLVPHFEKMLYDNAQLAVTYLETFQVTGNKFYREVVEDILVYVQRDMCGPNGEFFSAEDADSEEEEGKFYVWGETELQRVLTAEEFNALAQIYDISSHGNFEDQKNILSLRSIDKWRAKSEPQSAAIHKKLLELRSKRIRPLRDDKVLTSWNALMISAFAKAASVCGKDSYLQAAEKAASFIKGTLYKEGLLYRRYRDGEIKIPGMLDDYALLIRALIDLYLASQKSEWLLWAKELQGKQDELFQDKDAPGYNFSQAKLIMPLNEFIDGAEPNPNAVSALNLFQLSQFFLTTSYREKAHSMIEANSVALTKYPQVFSSLLMAFDYWDRGAREVVVALPNKRAGEKESSTFLATVCAKFLPNCIYAKVDEQIPLTSGKVALDGKVTYYLCQFGRCEAPQTELSSITQSLSSPKV